MNETRVYLKIASVAREVFSRKTRADLDRIRDHFAVAYSEAQLCALVVVGLILRIFHLLPDPPEGRRSMWLVMDLLMQFLQNLDWNTSRGGPNPLDELLNEGAKALKEG